ncbi:MAG: hypothetical protein P8P77_08115, partial [Crocinitomicaceae bacterium]|nr:hypothetical protein [Crocinitomicaceae bacterium]
LLGIDISEKISERSKNLFFGNTNFQRGFGANCSKYARAKRKKPIYSSHSKAYDTYNRGEDAVVNGKIKNYEDPHLAIFIKRRSDT